VDFQNVRKGISKRPLEKESVVFTPTNGMTSDEPTDSLII
jgi:hypothetical protein